MRDHNHWGQAILTCPSTCRQGLVYTGPGKWQPMMHLADERLMERAASDEKTE